jgi:NAD(P)H-hydrate epimerase
MKSQFKNYLARRKVDAHKGDFGHVLVLAGSPGFTGAAYLCSQAAILSGAGLVTLGIPRSLNPIMAVKLTEVMTRPLAETERATLSPQAETEILSFLSLADVLALGPGISQNPQTRILVHNLIAKVNQPIVLDADGINAFKGCVNLLKKNKGQIIITPHPGEMARLMGLEVSEIQKKRKEIAKSFAKDYNMVCVLKGHHTVVASAKGEIYINNTGNPGMASGGCGDILTGMIAAFLGQRVEAFKAAKLAVYLHGLAGDLAAKEKGEVSLIASDVLEKLPEAIKKTV